MRQADDRQQFAILSVAAPSSSPHRQFANGQYPGTGDGRLNAGPQAEHAAV